MFGRKILLAIASLFVLSTSLADAQKKIVCYWYPGVSGLTVSTIDVNICTHIIFSFLEIDSNGGISYQTRTQNYVASSLSQLRARSSSIKIIAAFGGYNEALLSAWSNIAQNENTRTNFANNVYNFLTANNLDGVDVDWEYPNFSSNIGEKPNLVALLGALKQRLGSTFSVSLAIGAGPWRTSLSYDIPGIFANCDFVNLMSYDMHGGWEGKTGLHSALFRGPLDQTTSNVHDAVMLLLNSGIERSKLIVGIPVYGYAFTLTTGNNGIGAPAVAAAAIPYRDLCQRLRNGALNYQWEDSQKVPYAFNGNLWVSFDDLPSVAYKSKYIVDMQLGGAMFWALDNDDYDGVCGSGRFPLISTVSNILRGSAPPQPTTTTTQSPVTTTTTATTTTRSSGGGGFSCPSSSGFFKDPADCSKFYQCANGFFYSMACGSGLRWHDAIKACDWPYNVNC